MKKNVVKHLWTIWTILSILVIAFIGGFTAFIFTGLWKGPMSIGTADPVAIANTYIVYTTIIFVGITIILALMGFVFTQQFSMAKEMQVNHLILEIEDGLKKNLNDRSIKLIDAALDNPDVQTHVAKKIESKFQQLMDEKVAGLKRIAKKSADEAAEAESLSDFINGAEEKR